MAGSPRLHHVVLERDGHPVEGADARSPSRAARVGLGRRARGLLPQSHHRHEALVRCDPPEAGVHQLGGADLAAIQARSLLPEAAREEVSAYSMGLALLLEHFRHEEGAARWAGALATTSSGSRGSARVIGPQRRWKVESMDGRRHAIGVERVEGAHMAQDLLEVTGHRPRLLFREGETRKRRDIGDIRGTEGSTSARP